MSSARKRYIWQQAVWPKLSFSEASLSGALVAARRSQALIEAKAQAIGMEPAGDIARDVLMQEVVATAAIEGEKLDPDAVRSSVMRKLGLSDTGPAQRHVDGLVEVISDATQALDEPLDSDRLCRWQAALFPGGISSAGRIAVGQYRKHADPMQIVSGHPGREVVHYEAPASAQVPHEMAQFLAWFNSTVPGPGRQPVMDGLARAAIAHLWFETIHPFEDGNGRIGRAIADMAIAQDTRVPTRLYSLSRQLLQNRSAYYDALNRAQCGTCDLTDWVQWFIQQFADACQRSSEVIDIAIEKSRFWARSAQMGLNDRQRKVLQRLLDDGDGGFQGGLNAAKYMKMTGASKATATRDLAALLHGQLVWTNGQGKALRYYVNVPGWLHGVDAIDGA
jgi:Fic family protein